MNSSIACATCRPGRRSAAFWSAATGLLIVSLALHVWRIDSAPPGFFIDESANAYNACCIARTGADEYGTSFPVFFRCFDDYSHDPVVIYTMAPVVGIFGLQRWAARLPNAIVGVLASVAFAFLVQQHCRRRWLSLLSGFCFSVIPWLFPASRSAVSGYTLLVWEMIMAWLLALTPDRMHSGRCVQGVIFWLLTAAIGAGFLWRRRLIGRAILLAACCAGIVETGWYLRDYFGPYQVRCRPEFTASFIEVLRDCFRALGENKTLYISASTFSPYNMIPGTDFKPYFYIHLLFFGRIDPLTYQHGGIPRNRVVLYDGSITTPGLLLRCTMSVIPPEAGHPLPLAGATFNRESPTYIRNPEPIPPNATLLETKPVDGPFPAEVRYEVYEVK